MLKKNSYLSYIDGKWLEGKDFIKIINPSNNKEIGLLADVGEDGAKKAIVAANNAFKKWSKETAVYRSKILKNWFQLIIECKNEIAEIITEEAGKPKKESLIEVEYGASFIEWFAEQSLRINGNLLESNDVTKKMMILKQPIGVVSAITPWNFPVAMVTRKAAAAIAAGCTVVLKPSELTPISAIKLAELAHRAGLPKGVFNVINGKPENIGKIMSTHPMVKKITFTGSTKVGKYLMENASKTVKSISLELGGNAPFIVFDDANIDDAVNGLVESKFRNAGQTCISANRIFLQKEISKEFIKKLKYQLSKLKVGDGFCNNDIGPLISENAIDKIKKNIDDAKKKGAKILFGGKTHSAGKLFFEPTIITNVKNDMLVFKTENFGPIVPIVEFENDEDVVNLSNNTEYGLASYFYTKDVSRVWNISANLDFGMFGVNTGKISSYLNPFGGLKQSGIGREGSQEGLEPFLEKKFISWKI